MGRFERTEAYRTLGVFGCSDILAGAGIERPTEQMLVICNFVVHGLDDTVIPQQGDQKATGEWLRRRLLEMAARWRHQGEAVATWSSLILQSMAIIAWNPYREFGDLLSVRCGAEAFRRVVGRLRKQGFQAHRDILLDLKDEFASERLPKAVRTFDPAKGAGHETEWLTTAFYRFAVQALVSDRINRAQLETLPPRETVEVSPEQALAQAEEERLRDAIPQALAALSGVQRTALALYFGLSGREATLAEIGERLDLSEYKARNAVILGLARLASVLGVQGVLDDEEFAYLTLLFHDGMDANAAAKRLNVRRSEMQKRIAEKFQHTLRLRTPRATPTFPIEPEDTTMQYFLSYSGEASNDELRRRIVDALFRLREAPPLRVSEDRKVLARLSEMEVSIGTIRSILDPHLIRQLEAQNVPLDWLGTGPEPSERADVPPDAALNAERLDRLRQRQWVIAETLYTHCCGHNRDDAAFRELREHTVERILVTLIAVAQGIESALPPDLLAQREAEFQIEAVGDETVLGRWYGSPQSETIDLKDLVREQAVVAGEIHPDLAALLAEEIARGLLCGEFGLPGLPLSGATGRSAALSWSLPVLERDPTESDARFR